MAIGIKDRLIHFARTQYNMGQNKFEDHCGICRGTINAIGKGISTTTLEKIITACPELNVRWLITGEETPLRVDLPKYNDDDSKNSRSESFSSEVEQVSEEGEKRENRGGLGGKEGDVEFYRQLCKQQQATILHQQATISTLNETLNYILKK